MKRLALLALVGCALLAPAAAHATNECKGLQVCVPVAGPWVVTTPDAEVQYDLACPKNYIVAGLDAELSARGIDIGFVGGLGAPVNPGITTKGDAVFLGRLARTGGLASFRPHIGCVPAQGGGQRTPTAYHPFPPAKAIDRQVHAFPALPSRTVSARCTKGERLTDATHAIGFPGAVPPTEAAMRAVQVTQAVHNGVVTLRIRSTHAATVQLDLLCSVIK
ncbi:MAG: hypothetical protein ABUS54_06195 [Actinomycetota bacterium]